jgi:deazaflavin-dependent oxidoreductase (nitroreductase family)
MPAARRNALTELFFRIHPWIYRKTGGRVLGRFGGTPVLLLTTRGRKSGEPRTNGLLFLDRGDHWAVAASWAGEPKHPAWYLNLQADPDATIQIRNRRIPVRARELEGEERALVWKEIVAKDPSFAEYEERTHGIREIPVVVLEPREPGVSPPGGSAYVLHGLSCSYFTGKLQAYMQAKGLPYVFKEVDREDFEKIGAGTGIKQLPALETPEGTWLTDTTAILEHFESREEGPRVRPADPAAAFCSLLLEDLFDEWYWRPALYYRWAFDEDAQLMSSQLARVMLRGVPVPHFLARRFIRYRQRRVYLDQDGVTKGTGPAIEAHYRETLHALDEIFARRPFLFGERPCEADYGLFGPFFRHFFCDPTPGALMRELGPRVTHWVTRLWQTRPVDLEGTPEIGQVPDDLGFFFEMIARDYLPYLEANARAVAEGSENVSYRAQGVAWQIPTAPYRAECFNELKRRFAELDADAARRVADLLPASAIEQLEGPLVAPPSQPGRRGPLGRLGRPAGMLA